MRASRWGLLLAGVAACTFPDVTYSDGGVTDGGVCPQLAGCENTAKSCNATAEQQHTYCMHGCYGQQQCQMACNDTLDTTRAGCATNCEACAPVVCGDATSACQAAAGVGWP
jgi:hypothetical protein